MKMKIFMLAAIVSCSHVLFAQQDSARLLDDVVVTATKYPIKQSLTGKVVTVINLEQLQRNAGKSLGEILNTQAGVVVNGSGNVDGTNQDIYMRGASTGNTLILLDGVPVYDPAGISGAFDINFIPADQLERIEILKGSQSTLYGSDAIAGVINLISKKGESKPVNFSSTQSGGSFGTYRGNVGVNGTIKKTSYQVNYSKAYSKGFSSAFDESNANNFDDDGFNRDAVSVNVGQKFSDKFSLHASGRYSKYKTDVDAGRFTDDKDYTINTQDIFVKIGADYKIGKNLIYVNYSYNQSERNYLDDSTDIPAFAFSNFSKGEYKGKSHFAEAYSNLSLTKNLDLLIGADFRHQSTVQNYLSLGAFGPYVAPPLEDTANVKQVGIYASLMLKNAGGLNIELGGRYNYFNKYGSVVTFSFSPSYTILSKLKIFANVASGFKAPSLYQVYSEYRNPFNALDPEKSLSVEGGVQYYNKNVNIRAVYFIRNVKDNIQFFSAGAPNYESYYVNADEQKDKGFELEAKARFGKLQLSVGYTNLNGYLHVNSNGKDTTYFNLYRRPRQSVNLDLGIDITQKWILNIGAQTVGRRSESFFGGATEQLEAYTLWNVYSSYSFTPFLKLFADLKNITDQQYFELSGYNNRRFNFMAGLSIRL